MTAVVFHSAKAHLAVLNTWSSVKIYSPAMTDAVDSGNHKNEKKRYLDGKKLDGIDFQLCNDPILFFIFSS